MAKSNNDLTLGDWLRLLLGAVAILAAIAVWIVGYLFLRAWLDELLEYEWMDSWLYWAVLLWPLSFVVLACIVGFLCLLILETVRAYRASEEAARQEEERRKAMMVRIELRAFRRRNVERVRNKVVELDMALQSEFEAELARNIESARDEYQFLIKTVEAEEASLRDISDRHPNISGFLQTRSIGDSKASSVANLGRFLEQVETT